MVAGKPFYGGSRYGPNGMSRFYQTAPAPLPFFRAGNFALFRLPRELRDKIYVEVVKDGEDTAVNVMWPGYHTIPALGMVNKQAYGELMPIWDEEYVKRHAFEALCIHQEDIKTAIKWARRNLPVQGGGLYGKNFTLIFHGVFDPEWDFAPFRPVYELQYDIHLVPDTQRLLDIQLRAYIRTSEEQSFLNCLGRLLRDAKRRAERPGGTKGPADMQQGFLRICRVLKQQAERETAH